MARDAGTRNTPDLTLEQVTHGLRLQTLRESLDTGTVRQHLGVQLRLGGGLGVQILLAGRHVIFLHDLPHRLVQQGLVEDLLTVPVAGVEPLVNESLQPDLIHQTGIKEGNLDLRILSIWLNDLSIRWCGGHNEPRFYSAQLPRMVRAGESDIHVPLWAGVCQETAIDGLHFDHDR